ncbi:hypothetical protein BN10_740004 [Phycicoccus elongatus Lp2]|uniref:Phytanoyl-CoA dioxygenase n=1 Tax=Phycicoccus elongatus Lp2 TaxID=1193181 RepID=N0E278_9MICO|nr:phytanoyl-CoA dioxygenase family protein [Phycicoccus elongatus]CCH70992.1 hypothetical protein BN10_740004 [Phycicoccus elongatus Lp2]
MTIGAVNRQDFHNSGLATVALPDRYQCTLDAIADSLSDAYADDNREVGDVRYFSDRIMDVWGINEHVRRLALAPQVLELLAQLFGRRPLPFQTLNFRSGTQQHLHSDATHFSSDPGGFVAAGWVALENITMDTGPVVYYPGSHALAGISMGNVSRPRGPHSEDVIKRALGAAGIIPHYGQIPRGHALIWVGDLVHGGASVLRPGATRHSQVTHYFFDKCRYWVPKLSSAGAVQWRDPRWIS